MINEEDLIFLIKVVINATTEPTVLDEDDTLRFCAILNPNSIIELLPNLTLSMPEINETVAQVDTVNAPDCTYKVL